ncbi:MAG: acyl-[acyl-carrier-protein] thioesterase [Prevotella sp.]|nr:acyl-[acyl-carrier-protein] thioesterase [Prevotella sp.]
MDKVGRYGFLAEPFHCDFSGRLFMGHLGNHLLNAADYHSHDRGFGMAFLNTINKTWVLSRLAVEMDEMPRMYARFDVETWVESAMRFFTKRNFKVIDQQTGKVYGYGRSIWAMIDTETRQPANLLDVNDGALLGYVEKDKPCPIAKSSRVNSSGQGELVAEIHPRYNDIDINGHVNSVKYIEHVLDLFSLEWYASHRLHRFEVAYVAEAHAGDTLRLYRETNDGLTFVVRVVKASADSDEVEICRCAVAFVKE